MRQGRGSSVVHEIAPDEIFLDSSNLPGHESSQFEGRVAKPLSRRAIVAVGLAFLLVALVFAGRAFSLQIVRGSQLADASRFNTLSRTIIFSSRGVIYDRTGRELAWNEPQQQAVADAISTTDKGEATSLYALRRYASASGLSHVLGFVQYPKADSQGNWWRTEYAPISGVELAFNDTLAGANGSTMVERDAHGNVEREDIVARPKNGEPLTLSIDADVQSKLYEVLFAHASEQGFDGGAAVIMDVRTGEILALTSFPEYDNQAFTDGNASVVRAETSDASTPLLDRAVSGLYTPGSIVKPIFAAAALNEGIISPDKDIVSTGAISIPNPYDPDNPTLFRDWTVHGPVNMREAIAVSSDEYFYTIGGGYEGQQGLGIARLDEYAKLFGLGEHTGIELSGEQSGVIPTPEWKAITFGEDDPWRIGNTYHTAIGQYGFQITPIQAAVFAAAIGNGGKLLKPQLVASSTPQFRDVGVPDKYLQVAREGMRLAVTSDRTDATVKFFNMSGIELAAKTGTAQLGLHNEWMNSWSIGFWPASDPKYAYAVVLEHAPAGTLSGAAPGMLPFFRWLIAAHPEYVK
ncbi:MAG: penicillin-binding transpeptidase domain-containing protein [Patescibacteria group bacterium]|nr:penicillin-binding transpeptidase domain-containing protein [Patescibacteria group bacterium]